MRVLIENGQISPGAVVLHRFLRDHLVERGFQADLVANRRGAPLALGDYDALFSNRLVPDDVRRATRCWGGRLMPRPASLRLMEAAGVPVMRWDRARSAVEIEALRQSWGVERLLLKRSFTCGGRGVTVFDPSFTDQLTWAPDDDVFCPEVGPGDGDVYKAEVFAGDLIIAWKSNAAPLGRYFTTPMMVGVRGAYGTRSLHAFDPEMTGYVLALSRRLTEMGVGYVSVDFMKNPSGAFEAIELNLFDIATWWTTQMPGFCERYARALHAMLVGLAGPP